MRSPILRGFGSWLGLDFTYALNPVVRYNVFTELWGSVAFGVFWAAAIQFVPVVLRRLGAGPELIALYTAQTYLGAILTSLSIVLMRGRRTKNFAVWCWMVGRSTFFVFAIINEIYWLMGVMVFFWLLEQFPSPAYTRIIQGIYPVEIRGKAMFVGASGHDCFDSGCDTAGGVDAGSVGASPPLPAGGNLRYPFDVDV